MVGAFDGWEAAGREVRAGTPEAEQCTVRKCFSAHGVVGFSPRAGTR